MKKYFKHVLVALSLISFGSIYAQISTEKTTEAVKTGKNVVVESMTGFDFLMKGGFFLIPISILLLYTIFVAVEKYMYIKRSSKLNGNLLSDVRSNLNSGNIDNAISLAERDNSSIGEIVKEGILTIGRPISEIESNMDKVSNIEIAKMERSLGHLGLIAGIAPTLGFIGTISGVIKIFYKISITENVSIGNISGGLYEKMISSGSGLIVGIIAFSAYHLLNGMIDSFSLKVQKINLEFVNIIQRPDNGNKTK
jgi:biopolymer transport protein ExbB